ncbi:MAG TPA: cupin domain-containing protein [Nocardioides sp.]|nr:cupin domain-containing protein [Nocardioides sp.]
MRVIDAAAFRRERAWEALDIESIDDATVRLHWTDQPYKWHVNDGPEVFVVLAGEVDMGVRSDDQVETHRLGPGMIFHAEAGDEHVAVPVGEARVLVVERRGSV